MTDLLMFASEMMTQNSRYFPPLPFFQCYFQAIFLKGRRAEGMDMGIVEGL